MDCFDTILAYANKFLRNFKFKIFKKKYQWNSWERQILSTIFEPVHEISNSVVCATGIASDQPAHSRSLIRAFASRLSILWLLSYWLNTIWGF